MLFAGHTGQPQELPKAIGVDEEEEGVGYSARYVGSFVFLFLRITSHHAILTDDGMNDDSERAKSKYEKPGKRAPIKSRQWIMKKKETQRCALVVVNAVPRPDSLSVCRKQGKKVVEDSKYTGRRRPHAF